ncbi:MAG: sodium:alanine symporter family protein [Longimicrobiales bacterium]|nr:sodium:alanine symporter family protein [Longimicrobiales bacterium]
MDVLEKIVDFLNANVVEAGIPAGEETIPYMVILLIGVGLLLTVRTGFVQIRHLGHGFAVATGRYDDPDEPGDVTHFQALTTALSATVGIGNIAGVAIAIHWGGPGAIFWMWVTAAVGMATKFSEVTLAQRYRETVSADDPTAAQGSVSGGPMYYIEKGLGRKWKPMAVFFAVLLMFTSFLTGNAVQANTVADTVNTSFGVTPWITGLLSSLVVGAVILGGITRIGRVTSILAPAMAAVYVFGALVIIFMNAGQIVPAFGLILTEAFNPSAGIAGTGVGVFLVTLMWGVRRGLFSNEAGQGSAPIAHAAAKTDEPVSEGVVALLEPFIDTIVICTMTALVIIMTGVWNERIPTEITLSGGDLSWVEAEESGRYRGVAAPGQLQIVDGVQDIDAFGTPLIAWHEVAVERLYTDPEQSTPFNGTIDVGSGVATDVNGQTYTSLHGNAVESGAPLTLLGFQRGLPGSFGGFIVVLSVMLFAVSTAISWSYYGDRCAYYLFGASAVFPFKAVFVAMHFFGAIVPLAVVWSLGDIALAIVIIPNLIALLFLSGQVREMSRSYFERRPWETQPGAMKKASTPRE